MDKPTLSQMVETLISSGMTAKSIAEKAGCDISTISRIRRGKITDPKYSIASAIDVEYQRVKTAA